MNMARFAFPFQLRSAERSILWFCERAASRHHHGTQRNSASSVPFPAGSAACSSLSAVSATKTELFVFTSELGGKLT